MTSKLGPLWERVRHLVFGCRASKPEREADTAENWIRRIIVRPEWAEAELRRKLYAMGFSKRAIATAVKDVESEAG
jgi:SOS response regulatory protein OraA/RecX